MDFARQEVRAEVSPSCASPPQLPPSPKSRPRARRQSQAEEERGEGGVRREPRERGENGRRSPGSQLGFAYQTGANGPSGPGRPFLARIKQTLCASSPRPGSSEPQIQNGRAAGCGYLPYRRCAATTLGMKSTPKFSSWFRPGPYVQQWCARGTILRCTMVLVEGGYKRGGRGGRASKSQRY
jgi:hypothetical protein